MPNETQEPSRGHTALGCVILLALAVIVAIGGYTVYGLIAGDDDATARGGLAAEVAALPVAAERDAGYDRDLFGDYDRDRVLDRDQRGCGYYSRYDNQCHRSPDEVHADHTVALAEAWRSGAWQWDSDRRDEFAADTANLTLMTAELNISKSDQDPASWLPEQRLCGYVQTWVEIKTEYGLTVDRAERDALLDAAEGC